MSNEEILSVNKYLGAVVESIPEKFEEFDFTEPALMWYPDVLHIARMNELERTSLNFADWILGNFNSCQNSFVKDLFCEELEEIHDSVLKSHIKIYFTDKSKEEIVKSVENIIKRLNGATCVQLANYVEWSVAIVE